MQGNRVTYSFHTPGALAANQTIIFTLPFPATLIHASFVGTNANNCIVDVENTGTAEAYIKDKDCGDSSVPGVVDAPEEFVGSNYPHIAAGTVMQIAVDFDGAGGTAVQNFTTVLTFMEG